MKMKVNTLTILLARKGGAIARPGQGAEECGGRVTPATRSPAPLICYT